MAKKVDVVSEVKGNAIQNVTGIKTRNEINTLHVIQCK